MTASFYPILKQGRFHNVRCCPTTTMSWNPCMTTPGNSSFAAGNGSNQPIPSKIAHDTYHQPWIQGVENWELASCNLHRCFRTTRSAQPGASPKETRQHRYEDVSWLLMIGRQECCCHFEVGITRGDWVLLCWNPNGSNINLQNVFGNESFHSLNVAVAWVLFNRMHFPCGIPIVFLREAVHKRPSFSRYNFACSQCTSNGACLSCPCTLWRNICMGVQLTTFFQNISEKHCVKITKTCSRNWNKQNNTCFARKWIG